MSAQQPGVPGQGDSHQTVQFLRQLIILHLSKPTNVFDKTKDDAAMDEYNAKVNEVLRFLIKILESRLMPCEIELQDQVLISDRVKKKRTTFCDFPLSN